MKKLFSSETVEARRKWDGKAFPGHPSKPPTLPSTHHITLFVALIINLLWSLSSLECKLWEGKIL